MPKHVPIAGPGSRLYGARTKPNRQRGGSFLRNKKPMLIALPPGVQHGFSARGLGVAFGLAGPVLRSLTADGGLCWRLPSHFIPHPPIFPRYQSQTFFPTTLTPVFLPTQFYSPRGSSHPFHLPFLHFNSHSSSQFRFFWPSEAPGCVFLSQTINSSPKKINA